MNSFLLYILKSTFCISLFYLGFRMLLHKETFFRLNRILLLSAVIFSAIIPAIQLPQFIQPAAQNEWISPIQEMETTLASQPISEETVPAATAPTEQTKPVLKEEFTWLKLVQNTYLAGILISFLILIYGIISILILFRKARFMQMDGFRLLIIDRDVPPFSFGRFVIISQADYDAHQQTILAHEEAHIRLNHFFDLAVLETVKLFHWFNPAMYWLIRDMKEIHEFQADEYTLRKGIDPTQYQILIIQKSVGPQRFALANSFNHCQIKKRITMMNKSKTSKAWRWKVATFLPLLALLLVFCSKKSSKEPAISVTNIDRSPITEMMPAPQPRPKIKTDESMLLVEFKEDGNYINDQLYSGDDFIRKVKEWRNAGTTGNNPVTIVSPDFELSDSRNIELTAISNATGYHFVPNLGVDKQAVFPGGISGMFSWIKQNTNYPIQDAAYAWSKDVVVSFVVNTKGQAVDARIVKSRNPEMDAEALRVVSQMPAWKPAMENGLPVNVERRISIPFKFK